MVGGNYAIRGDAIHEEDVGADDGAFANDGFAAQHGGVGVDDDVVANGGVALDVFDGKSGEAEGEGAGAERDTLVQFDVVADFGGFPDDDAGGVVNEEGATNAGAGVNVGAGFGMGPLAHDAGDDGYIEKIEFVGEAVAGNGHQAGIGEQDLGEGEGGGVAIVGGLHVGDQELAHGGQGVEKGAQNAVGFGVEILDLGQAGTFGAGGFADPAVGQGAANFVVKQSPGFAQAPDEKNAEFGAVYACGTDAAGKEDVEQDAQGLHGVAGRGGVGQQGIGGIHFYMVEEFAQGTGGHADFGFRRTHLAEVRGGAGFLFH